MIQIETTAEVLAHAEKSPRKFIVHATCMVSIGDTCTVYFPDHEDHESYMFHINCHGQSARIIGFGNSGVDIEITSGSWAGKTITSIQSKWLIMDGTFILQK